MKKVTKTKRSTEVDEAPMFKVLVIGDEEYNREHVVLSIQDIVPDTDNTRVRHMLLPYTIMMMTGVASVSEIYIFF